MSFARTTAVAGVGTVSCTGTTTVTGTGTTFATLTGSAAGAAHARVGGTITVGGVTKTIVSIQSTTQLTTDTAFGAFTGSAFTVQTGVTQTGTDTMNLSLGSATGFTITNRADLLRTFDIQGNDLFITGTLTVDSTVAQLRNDGSCNNSITITGSVSGGELKINGQKSTANNGPFPYAGFDWLGTNGLKIMRLDSTNATYPAKFTIIDACVRYGADWVTTYANNFSRITTQGSICWILCAKGTGTGQARLRQDNNTASIDFQATKTFIGVWLNFGVPQISLSGYTPINTDGPEINVSVVATASLITAVDYNSTYVVPNYYAGASWTNLGGAWVDLENNLKGSNFPWYSQSVSGVTYNVLQLSKRIIASAVDAVGSSLSNGYLYYQPVGSNVAGVRAKGGTADITFDLSKKTIAFASGSATSKFTFAWSYANGGGLKTTYSYFCTGTTAGSETQTVYSSRYGYDTQSSLITLSGNGNAVPKFIHTSLPTTDKVIANAAALNGVSFNFTTKTMTITGNNTIQTVYDQYQYQRNLPANLGVVDECTVSNGRTNYVGWTIVVNAGVTLSEGGNFTEIQAGTVTNNGTITAIYVSSAGTSTIWRFEDIQVGSSIVVYDSTGVTKYFQGSVTSAGDYNYYIPPGTTGTYYWAIEKYGKQRQSGSFAANTGGLLFYAPIYVEDVGITQTVQATVSAYTEIETPSKFYDRTAVFRLTEQGIKVGQIVTRSGTAIEIQSGLSHVINKHEASVYALSGSVITTKSVSYAADAKYKTEILVPPATLTADTTEVITIAIEDANGNSQLTINGGDGNFQLWKVTTATATADYATGTLLATVGNGIYRFIGVSGYDIVGVDTNSNIRRRTSMAKGIYTQAFYVGDQIQLAQAPEVLEILTKVEIMQVSVDDLADNVATVQTSVNGVPTAVLSSAVETGATVVESLRLHNAVLGGKVSGAGTGVESFRDLSDSKDRLISTVDANGNRITEVPDLT